MSLIDRRAVILGLALILAAPRKSQAQPAGGVRRVGLYLPPGSSRKLVVEALQEMGWTEGRNIAFEWPRNGDTEAEIRQYLGKAPIHVLVPAGPHRLRAAMRATTTVPIVAIDLESDPVTSGFVKTLARPGSNVTGVWMDLPEIAGKQIQFLREVVPTLSRLGELWDDRIGGPQFVEAQAAARAANISLHPALLRSPEDAEPAVRRLIADRVQAAVILTAPIGDPGRRRVAELTRQHRLPSITPISTYPADGGLMAYGPEFPAMWRQLAGYVDRVLRGANAGDLPVERPSKFVLVVNLKTAKDIGLSIPQALILRADQVIQ